MPMLGERIHLAGALNGPTLASIDSGHWATKWPPQDTRAAIAQTIDSLRFGSTPMVAGGISSYLSLSLMASNVGFAAFGLFLPT